MSEKGQGEESAAGTATGIDGGAAAGAAGGGGSQAEQSGTSAWDDPKVRAALEAAIDRPAAGEEPLDLGKPEIPEMPSEEAQDPQIPGGGPTDTRTGWDYPEGQDGPRGDPAESEAPPVPDTEEKPKRGSRKRARRRGAGSGTGDASEPPTLQNPPSGTPKYPLDRPPGLSDEQFEEFRKQKPSILDQVNPDDQKQVTW